VDAQRVWARDSEIVELHLTRLLPRHEFEPIRQERLDPHSNFLCRRDPVSTLRHRRRLHVVAVLVDPRRSTDDLKALVTEIVSSLHQLSHSRVRRAELPTGKDL